ncbi:MAG: hypothetical protein K2G86_03965, partial [Prevotella sp.]|nr:hypothetical protein [Prevotella sp.]
PVYRAPYSADGWQRVRLPVGMRIPRVTVTGDRPSLMLVGNTYVGSNGDNTTTADNVEVHFSLSSASKVTDGQIAGYVVNLNDNSILDYLMTNISMNAGETGEFVMRGDLSKSLTAGNEYGLVLMDYTTGEILSPDASNAIVFRVVEPSGISGTVVSANGQSAAKVDVYSMAGTLLRRGVPASEALSTLPAGIYVVGGKKVVKK